SLGGERHLLLLHRRCTRALARPSRHHPCDHDAGPERMAHCRAAAGVIANEPARSPFESRPSASTQEPFSHPPVFAPPNRIVPAFQSTMPSRSALNECIPLTSQRDATCQIGRAAALASST